MIFHGPKHGTTGSKRVKNICLGIPNGPGSLLRKGFFDPFLSHFWSQNGRFSRHFVVFRRPKRATTRSRRAQNTCLSILNGPQSLFRKGFFDPFLSHFWSQDSPFSRHFQSFRGPKRATTGSERAKNTCFSIPSGLDTFPWGGLGTGRCSGQAQASRQAKHCAHRGILMLMSCDKAFQDPCHSETKERKYVQQHIRICTHGLKTGLR